MKKIICLAILCLAWNVWAKDTPEKYEIRCSSWTEGSINYRLFELEMKVAWIMKNSYEVYYNTRTLTESETKQDYTLDSYIIKRYWKEIYEEKKDE